MFTDSRNLVVDLYIWGPPFIPLEEVYNPIAMGEPSFVIDSCQPLSWRRTNTKPLIEGVLAPLSSTFSMALVNSVSYKPTSLSLFISFPMSAMAIRYFNLSAWPIIFSRV